MKQPIIIIGLHRSFTSILTQCFEDAGVCMYLKPENKTIHNEDKHLLDLNIAFMHVNGKNCEHVMKPSRFTTGEVLFNKDLSYYKIERGSRGNDRWGFKAPRIASLIDFYYPVFPDAKYICCIRNFMQCGSSWVSRGNSDNLKTSILSFSNQLKNILDFSLNHPIDLHFFNANGNMQKEQAKLREFTGVNNLDLSNIKQK